jgi:hypothetical protein
LSTISADFLAGLEPQTVYAPRPDGRTPDARVNCETAGELSAWLAALASFFELSNHPFSESELGGLGSRNFVHEAGIAQQVLRRCLSLGLSVAPEDESARGMPHAHGDLLASLADLCAVCDSMVESRRVSLGAWESFGGLVSSELSRPRAAGLCAVAPPRQYLSTRRPELLGLCGRISPAPLAADVLAAFAALALALERLNLLEPLLRRDRPLKQSLPVFTLVRRHARELSNLIEARAARACEVQKATYEALDGAAYALDMELNKVYTRELVGLAASRHAPTIYAKVENAFGLLRDCLQQTVIGLARLFEPEFDAAQLFPNVRGRLEQSLFLREELWELLELVRRAERERERRPVSPLVARLRAFEEGPMRFLMFKDWESFERFAAEVAAARGVAELGPVLHRFGTYLEALFNQINMRAVLADHPFDFPPVAD